MRLSNPIRQLNSRLFFTVNDAAQALEIKPESARVLCSRYAKAGAFLRLRNNFYVTEQRWGRATYEDFLRIANFLQVPSYISFLTALARYEITTQVPRQFFENACLRRTKNIEAAGTQFVYSKLKKELYFDFTRKDGVFIATPEKALLDAVYLYSFGKYKLDFSALDINKINLKRIKKILHPFPDKTKALVKDICGI